MTNTETIAAELKRIQIELDTIARWREWTEQPSELHQLDETERYWQRQARRWLRLAERVGQQ